MSDNDAKKLRLSALMERLDNETGMTEGQARELRAEALGIYRSIPREEQLGLSNYKEHKLKGWDRGQVHYSEKSSEDRLSAKRDLTEKERLYDNAQELNTKSGIQLVPDESMQKLENNMSKSAGELMAQDIVRRANMEFDPTLEDPLHTKEPILKNDQLERIAERDQRDYMNSPVDNNDTQMKANYKRNQADNIRPQDEREDAARRALNIHGEHLMNEQEMEASGNRSMAVNSGIKKGLTEISAAGGAINDPLIKKLAMRDEVTPSVEKKAGDYLREIQNGVQPSELIDKVRNPEDTNELPTNKDLPDSGNTITHGERLAA